ncbi:copper ion binding protein [Pseudoglutamicibacter cumminsii]|uniref:copper ion binding protein n=1 Tax=Pseudoglutamicibacter cumminsii TaxID=156979 RepID=UPI00255697D2|nr:copper ion binding protein [Pseudoglutamicibacter cumminsii]MDK7083136.1 copper ion binding protein [Pseudoglutamicibacter cumminsii]MDZ3744887.1 copper ion binding protein [Pseudoglutamicibacter cumminsii]
MSVTLNVTGMTCHHCVSSVKEELGEIAGVSNIDVALNTGGTSVVTFDADASVTDDQIRDAIDEAGYDIAEVTRA